MCACRSENMLGALNDGWKVANRLLGSERFTTGHPRNAAVLLNKARQVAELTGATREAGFLHRLAALEIDLHGLFRLLPPRRRAARREARRRSRWRR